MKKNNSTFGKDSQRIADHIHDNLHALKDSQYGWAFSAWLLHIHGYKNWKTVLNEWMHHVPSDESHWEFQNLALIGLYERTRDSDIAYFLRHRTRHRHVSHTNWRLMRAVFYARYHRLLDPRPIWIRRAKFELKQALRNRTDGFFLDEGDHSGSMQYHAYSTLLLDLLGEEKNFSHVRREVDLSVSLINDWVLPRGEVAYVGRGQHQLFGAAAAMAILSRRGYIDAARRVRNHIHSFENNGAIPLVLSADGKKGKKTGWYSYNRAYDYLPFAGIMFDLASKPSSKETIPTSTEKSQNQFIHVQKFGANVLVVARPSNPHIFSESLPWPVVGTPHHSYFLSQGGSYAIFSTQFSPGSPFLEKTSAVEVTALRVESIKKVSKGWTLHSSCPSFIFDRIIQWKTNTLRVTDTVRFTHRTKGRLCMINIPFSDFLHSPTEKITASELKKNGFIIQAPVPLCVEASESAYGNGHHLRGYTDSRVFDKGDQFTSESIFKPTRRGT